MKPSDELRILKAEKDKLFENSINHLYALGDECFRIGDIFGNIGEILTDIDKDFARETGIFNKKDLSFLFTAIFLLCAKWVIMGQYMPLDFDFSYENQEKVDSKEGDKLAENKRKNDKKYGELKDEKDKTEDGHRTVNQIIFNGVPYDAQRTEAGGNLRDPRILPKGVLNSTNHRVYSLGHDEILGWVFGTLGIMTRSMTLKFPTLDTYNISEKGILIKNKSNIYVEVKEAYEAFNIENERLYAAVFKQGCHFLSDRFTKTGIKPIFMSIERYLELISQGWDSAAHANSFERFKKISGVIAKDAGIIAIQYTLSVLINEIIKAVHIFCFDEDKDRNIRLYQVRTRKILLTANCISSFSNVLFCAIFGYVTKNPIEAAKRLDIGGFIKTIQSLITDTKFIEEVKREYIRDNLSKKIYNSDFVWMYQDVSDNEEIIITTKYN